MFAWPIRVYWEDTDAGGIVFYANYLKYFERARTEWLRSLGLSQQALRQASGGMFVVGDTRIKYHRPARLDDLLLVTTTLTQTGRASLVLQQEAWLNNEQTVTKSRILLCEGQIRIGWVAADTLKSERIPSHLLEVLQ